MPKIEIDSYYDIRCSNCGMSRSTDIDGGRGMMTDKGLLQKTAYREGWVSRGGKTLCPACAKDVLAHRNPKSSRSHMLFRCRLHDAKMRRNARKVREAMPDGTSRLFCYGYTDAEYEGDVFIPECDNCPNNAKFAQDEFDRILGKRVIRE